MPRRAIVKGAAAGALTCSASRMTGVAVATGAGRAVSGDRFVVGDLEHIIDDIIAPRPDVSGFGAEPFALQSQSALQEVLDRGETVFEETRRDRWRRPVGRLINAQTGEPAEQWLVAIGAARVRPASPFHDAIRNLLDSEKTARDARRGLWRLSTYQLLDANDGAGWPRSKLRALTGQFHIGVGALASVAKRGRRIYFNFGADYRSDFTATFEGRTSEVELISGLDLATAAGDLVGRNVEVRGFLQAINGPSIALRHPLQILARSAV
ncbi:MAG: thermonuclease family protein [Pseudomonadota bacterium]